MHTVKLITVPKKQNEKIHDVGSDDITQHSINLGSKRGHQVSTNESSGMKRKEKSSKKT